MEVQREPVRLQSAMSSSPKRKQPKQRRAEVLQIAESGDPCAQGRKCALGVVCDVLIQFSGSKRVNGGVDRGADRRGAN